MEVSKELMQLFHPLSHKAYAYDSTRAYGNHRQVDLDDGYPSHATYNSRGACIFIQAIHSLTRDQNRRVAYLQYVGMLKEIVVVNCLGLGLVMFRCSWILANVHENTRTIWQDENGFWMVNFQRQLQPCVSCITKPILIFNVGGHSSNNIRKNPGPNH